MQENAFKDGNALGLSEHRRNCGRIVANVAVVSELERLEGNAKRDADTLRELDEKTATLEAAVVEHARDQQRAESALATRRGRLDELITQGKTGGKAFARAALDHQQALVHAEKTVKLATATRVALDKNRSRRDVLTKRAAEIAARRRQLEPQRTIRQLDTTQDTILTATKLTALQLISFAVREYLPTMPMTPQTFLQRVLPVRGRKESSPDQEACRVLREHSGPARHRGAP